MRRYSKGQAAAAILLAVSLFSSCNDISDPKSVNEYKLEAAAAAKTAGTAAYDASEQAEDDTQEADVIIETDFVTTGEERTMPAETAAKATTASTTFPVQTTPEEVLTVDAALPETTSAEITTEVITEPAATTAAQETTAAQKTTAAQETTQPPQTTDAQPAGEKVYNVIGDNGILVTYRNGHYMGIMPCFGTYSLCETWAKNVSRFAQLLPGVSVYNMVIPTSSEFYTPQAYWDSGFTTKQKNKIDHVRENLTGVTDVNVYDTLELHKDEEIFARTDHHWQPLGAYYAAEVFAASAGVDFPPLSKYQGIRRGGYVGSMYTYSKDVHLYNDAENFTMFISPNADEIKTTYYNTSFGGAYAGDLFVSRKASSFYCSFLGTDMTIAKVETDNKNGRTLVIFKESYGNALVPFLTSGFEKIYVCDIRYFDLNAVQFCKDVGATDLLFAVCTFTAAGGNGNYLKQLLG